MALDMKSVITCHYYFQTRSWGVSFSQVGSPNHVYGGFSNGGFTAAVNNVNKLNLSSTGFTVSTGILSGTDSTHDIGTNTNRFANIYADTLYGDGSNLTGISTSPTADTGGAIFQNSQTISASHTIPSGSNGMSAGPVTVNNGITLTISSGSTYTIV